MRFLLKSAVALLLISAVVPPALAANATSTNDQNASAAKGDQTSATESKTGAAVTEPKSESEKMNGNASEPAK